MEAPLYNQAGKKLGTEKLPAEIFALPWNADLVHQVVVSMQANARPTVADTKNRGEVRGGGKKPWRQKGTGRARHGSSRSPLWEGGGITHGPLSERSYEKKINKKMKTKALWTVLSAKARDGEVALLDDISFDKPATKTAQTMINALAKNGLEKANYKTGKRLLLILPEKNLATEKSFRNLQSVEVTTVSNLNPLSAIQYKYVALVEPEKTFTALTNRPH